MKRNSLLDNTFIRNSFAYIFASFIIKGISFITTPLFTRLMNTADYGVATNFLTWGQFVAVFICLLVPSSLVSANVNVAKGRISEYVYNLTIFSLASFLIVTLIVTPFSNTIGKMISVDKIFIVPLLVYAFGTSLSDLFSSYCIATNKVKEKIIFAITSSLLFVIVGVLFVVACGNKAHGRVWGYFTAYLLVSIFNVLFFLKIEGEKNRGVKEDLKYALAFSIPLIPHVIANLINGRIDIFFIMRSLGEDQVGIYSVAYAIGGIALTFATAATDAWTPWYYEQSKGNQVTLISKYFKLYTISISMCFLGVVFLAPEIMRIMAPEEYSAGLTCIPYVSLGIYFLFMYRFPLCYEQMLGNTKYVAHGTILAAIINIFLNMVLIPQHGIKGAALATTISYGLLWLFHEIVARKVMKGYNIMMRDSIYSLSLVLLACALMVLCDVSLIVRIIIVVVCCALYAVYVMRLIKSARGGADQRPGRLGL